MGKARKYKKEFWESDGASSDTSANLYCSMLRSPAWQDLTANQKTLYTHCKTRYYEQKRKPNGEREQFTFPQHVWAKEYRLYKESNYAGFQRDMEQLILHGFIACVSGGESTRESNIYRYSAKWHEWGKSGFEIPFSDMTPAMIRKRKKRK